MRDSLNAPLEYSPERYGYFYSDKTFILPGIMVTETEKQALTYLAGQFREADNSIAAGLADLFSKLTGEGVIKPEKIPGLPHIPLDEQEIKQYRLLDEAIHTGMKVTTEYVNGANVRTERRFCPYKIFRKSLHNYVVGFCEMREELRIFRLDRYKKITITNEPFIIPADFDGTLYGEDYKFNYREPYEAVVSFDAPININIFGIDSSQSDEREYRVKFQSSGQFLSELLALEADFRIIHPGWLRERLLSRLQRMFSANAGGENAVG
jgi:predicted DNA-binding transcriptional regulator YafY